jgi:hypothetical protein
MTYPSGTVTPLGGSLLLNNIDPNLWVTSADGTRTFYLQGGLSPIAPGIPGQDGIIVQSVDMSAPFKHKDLQAGSQDGVTWTQTVYEPGVIALQGEVHASTAVGLQTVWDAWQGTWNPRQLCTMEYITLDGGYWWAPVRLAKAWQGAVKQDRRYLYRQFTHECRIDDAFWRGSPATDVFSLPQIAAVNQTFSTGSGALSSSLWTTTYSLSHTGTVTTATGVGAYWSDTGNSTQSAKVVSSTATNSDYQIVSLQLGGSWQSINIGPSAYNDIYARVDSSNNAVVCRIGTNGVWLYRVNSGTFTQMFFVPLAVPPLQNEVWTFYAGTVSGNPRTFSLTRSGFFPLFGSSYHYGFPVLNFSEVATTDATQCSVYGSAARGVGFGLVTAVGTTTMSSPRPVAAFGAADHQFSTSASGFVTLCNTGTENGWPTYTLTGPASSFTIGDGPGGVSGSVSIGPIAAGQVVQVTTLPSMRSVIDVGNPTNNLYPLMSGRFTTPIPGVALPADASSVSIPVGINGGNNTTNIVAKLTPLRIHPA